MWYCRKSLRTEFYNLASMMAGSPISATSLPTLKIGHWIEFISIDVIIVAKWASMLDVTHVSRGNKSFWHLFEGEHRFHANQKNLYMDTGYNYDQILKYNDQWPKDWHKGEIVRYYILCKSLGHFVKSIEVKGLEW